MFDQVPAGLIQLIPVSMLWIAVIATASTIYRMTASRFDHSDRQAESSQFLLDARFRRRL
jgi:hypothetical protein